MFQLKDISFEAYTNWRGEPLLRVYDDRLQQVSALTLREAETLRHELDQAIEEAKSEERKLELRIAAREAAE